MVHSPFASNGLQVYRKLALRVKKTPLKLAGDPFLLGKEVVNQERVHYQLHSEPALFFTRDRVELPSLLSLFSLPCCSHAS
jgi:hypothetical protein